MIQNTKGSFNKFVRAVVNQIKIDLGLSTLEYRPWNKKTEYPMIKWHMGETMPPSQRQGAIYKHMTLFTLSVFVNEYQDAICSKIIDLLLDGIGFSIENIVYESFIDKYDYVNQDINGGQLIKIDDMHLRLSRIYDGLSIEPSEIHKQILIDVFHN